MRLRRTASRLAVLAAAAMVAGAVVASQPAGAEVPDGTRVIRTETVKIDPRHSEAQADRVEEKLEQCQDYVGPTYYDCEWLAPEPVEFYDRVRFELDGVVVFERILNKTYVQPVRITSYRYPEPPPYEEPEPWTPETSGCSDSFLAAHAGKEIRCGDDPPAPRQRAQVGSQSRPRATTETYVDTWNHDDDNDTPNVTRRTQVPHYPVARGTDDDCVPSESAGSLPSHYKSGGTAHDGLGVCIPVYQFDQASYHQAQQYGTLRRITTPAAFNNDAYNDDGDPAWSHEESDRAARAHAIHNAQWDAYDQAVDDAYGRGQPFWVCTHVSHFDVEGILTDGPKAASCYIVEP